MNKDVDANPDANCMKSPPQNIQMAHTLQRNMNQNIQHVIGNAELRRSFSPNARIFPIQRIQQYQTIPQIANQYVGFEGMPLQTFHDGGEQVNLNLYRTRLNNPQCIPFNNSNFNVNSMQAHVNYSRGRSGSPNNRVADYHKYHEQHECSNHKQNQNLQMHEDFKENDKVMYSRVEIENLLNELVSWRNLYYSMETSKKDLEIELESAKKLANENHEFHQKHHFENKPKEESNSIYSNFTNLMSELRMKEIEIQELQSKIKFQSNVHSSPDPLHLKCDSLTKENEELLKENSQWILKIRELEEQLISKERENKQLSENTFKYSALIDDMRRKLNCI